MSSPYDAERLRQRFSQDEDIRELGIEVCILDDTVFLRGRVPTEHRREAVDRLARAVLNRCAVVNEVEVIEMDEPRWERLE